MPEGAASHLEAIARHGNAILGPPKQHLHEHYSPDLHIDLIHYAPTADRDFHYPVGQVGTGSSLPNRQSSRVILVDMFFADQKQNMKR